LELRGADFALMASNTPHHRFDAIVSGIRIPLISIIDAVAKESARIGARQAAPAIRHSNEIVAISAGICQVRSRRRWPADEAVQTMTTELIADLQLCRTAGDSDRLEKIARRAFDSLPTHRPIVCLACRELPLAFEEMKDVPIFECDDVAFINGTWCTLTPRSISQSVTDKSMKLAPEEVGFSPAISRSLLARFSGPIRRH
jgi:aspartate racemase